jgi:hypothetical protein
MPEDGCIATSIAKDIMSVKATKQKVQRAR